MPSCMNGESLSSGKLFSIYRKYIRTLVQFHGHLKHSNLVSPSTYPQQQDNVIFDVCYMIQLMRNLFGNKKILCHEKNDKLHRSNWQYIKALNHFQEDLCFYWQRKAIRNILNGQNTKGKFDMLLRHSVLLLLLLLTYCKKKLTFQSLRSNNWFYKKSWHGIWYVEL